MRTASTGGLVRDGEAAVAPFGDDQRGPGGRRGYDRDADRHSYGRCLRRSGLRMTVESGNLANADTDTPTWTRPSVTSPTDNDIDLTVKARGTGTNATDGTSDDATAATVTATVRTS